MARVTNDVQQTTQLMSPGFPFVIESLLSLLVAVITIALLAPEVLLAPVIFLTALAAALWRYTARLRPISAKLRERLRCAGPAQRYLPRTDAA